MSKFLKQFIFIIVGVIKKPDKGGHFDVDPAGFAPASLGANTNLLLHTTRARIHDFIMNEKSPSYKGLSP